MRTKKKAQLRETTRSKLRERREGSASEQHFSLEETKAPHDNLHGNFNTPHTSQEVNALYTPNEDNTDTGDLHHTPDVY